MTSEFLAAKERKGTATIAVPWSKPILRFLRLLAANALVVLAAILSYAFVATASSAAEPVKLHVEVSPSGPVLAGARITLVATVYTTTMFENTPRFDLPQLPHALLVKYDESPTQSTMTEDGQSYIAQRHEIYLVVFQPGVCRIPPFQVTFESPLHYGGPPVPYTLTSPPLEVEAKAPPGTENLPGLVATSSLVARQEWKPFPRGTVKAGAGFIRTISLVSSDLPGMAMPPLPLTKVDGLAAYSKPPVVHDSFERGNFSGTRVDSVAYVCEQPGDIVFPALEIPWWNTTTNRLERIKLPGATLQVEPAAIAAAATDPAAMEASSFHFTRRQIRRTVGLAVVLAMVGFVLFRQRDAIAAAWRARRLAREESEAGRFAQLLGACHRNEPVETYRALLRWLEARRLTPGVVTLDADLPPDPELRHRASALEHTVLQPDHAWKGGAALAQVLRIARKKNPSAKTYRSTHLLPPLNPFISSTP